MDFDGNGKLNQEEVTETLTSLFPLDRSKFEVAFPLLWPRHSRPVNTQLTSLYTISSLSAEQCRVLLLSWDVRNSDSVTEEDFFANGGLLHFVHTYLLPDLNHVSISCEEPNEGRRPTVLGVAPSNIQQTSEADQPGGRIQASAGESASEHATQLELATSSPTRQRNASEQPSTQCSFQMASASMSGERTIREIYRIA